MKIFYSIIPALALLFTLSACYGSNKSEISSDTKSTKNQVLNLSETQEIPTMDVSKTTDSVSAHILGNVMEGLYRLDKNNTPIPGMAESYKKSDDGKTYTFTIRKNAKWSNGDAVTAHDFVFAWKRLIDPKTAAEYAFIAFPLKNAKSINEGKEHPDTLGVKAVDAQTLEVQLENPVPYFLNLMAFASFYPLNEKIVKEKGDKYGLEADTVVYNGPFIMSKWKHEEGWTLRKNNAYWDKEAVKLEEINFNIVKEPTTKVNLYENNQLDRTLLTSELINKYKGKKGEFGSYLETSTYFLQFNQRRNGQDTVFKNKKLREAIALSINKKQLSNVILNDGSKPADYLVAAGLAIGPDGKDFRESFNNGLSLDKSKAQKLWEEFKKETGKHTIQIELLNYDTGDHKKIGEYLKEQIEHNLQGITVNTKPMPFKQKLKLAATQDYDFSFAAWNPDYADPMAFIDMFDSKSSLNQMGYANPQYDEIVSKSKKEWLSDSKKRWNQLGKAEKILLEDDVAITPLFQSGKSFIQKPYVHNIYHHNISPEYSYKWTFIK
ncbi:peptide ABC transporter substrate-binding protein [Bacillus cereus]|uniref:peptide ABC transporter substrate-binding protein n=1 Tax=Bacillus cereus TaxID=1396 RepID=UPI0018F30B6E|nr:peptide ABC transporter substrate-binding protein [Bacillus cereus]MBJ8025976.1 peptide ABC transporter substrate-binding protein [Bacillus cereus]MBJ8038260.1 peptide ABC transporter substrate-binding protein [Bacillus cereus]